MVKLANDKGSIHISTDVFTWLAGDAATRCFGVKGMAGLSKESGLVQLLRRESMTKGVSVRPLDDNGIAIDLHIVVDRRESGCSLRKHPQRGQLQGQLLHGGARAPRRCIYRFHRDGLRRKSDCENKDQRRGFCGDDLRRVACFDGSA